MDKRKLQSGLSLIEMMVGLAIGLIAIIVIGQVTAVFEGQKRTTTGGADAQTNAGTALRELTRETSTAGYGMINAGLGSANGNQLCPLGVNIYYNGTVVSDPGSLPTDGGILAPVRIIDGATAAGGDAIIVARSDSEYGVLSTIVRQVVPGTITVDSALGYQPGQLFLIGSSGGTEICTLLQLSAAPTAVAGTWSAWNLPYAAGANYRYNPANPTAAFATFPTYAAGAIVVNMGYSPTTGNISADRSFIYRRYQVQCDKLAMVDPSQVAGPYDCANTTPVVDEIVNLQAQYGISLGGGAQAVDHWVDARGAWAYNLLTAAQINQIKAVRIAVVSRSPQLEKTDVSAATLTLWTTLTGGDDPAPTYTVPDRHYRYSVHTTIVPVKNVIWGKLL
jgi:type IV pilus assembly protein PilW